MTISRLLTVMLACCLLQAQAGEEPTRADLDKLKTAIQAAQQRIRSTENKKDHISEALRSTELKMARTSKRINNLTDEISQLQKQLSTLQDQQQQLEQQKQAQQATLDKQIAASYRMGREKTIKMLLNQEDPQKLSRAMTYADYFSRARVASLLRFQQTLQQLAQNRTAIQSNSDALLSAKQALIDEEKTLKSVYTERSHTLSQLDNSIRNEQQRLEKMQREQKQLEALLRSVNQAVASIRLPGDAVPFSNTRGKLRWPTTGKRDNRFGKKRANGDMTWEGVAFQAPEGQQVHAVHHGRVVFADWFRGKGLLMIIDHGDGYMTLYAHNQTLLRETGDWVSAGETIATVGNSGGLEKAELYFEIRHQGKPLNPGRWLQRG